MNKKEIEDFVNELKEWGDEIASDPQKCKEFIKRIYDSFEDIND